MGKKTTPDWMSAYEKAAGWAQGGLFDDQRFAPKPAPAPRKKLAVVIYHGHCPDGALAAWLLREHLLVTLRPSDVELVPALPGQTPAEVFGVVGAKTDVYYVDNSPDAKTFQMLSERAASVQVFDHHETAKPVAAVAGFHVADHECGASMVFKTFQSPKCYAKLVEYVRDLDLYLNELPDTLAVRRVIRKNLRHPEDAPRLARWFNDAFDLVVEQGNVLAALHAAAVEALAGHARLARLGGVLVQAVEVADAELASDVANRLAESGLIGVAFRKAGTQALFSLRSERDKGPDVTEVAKTFGGGGHKHAAGMSAPLAVVEWVA